MQTKLGKMQRLILVYTGVKTKALSKMFMPRRDLTTGLSELLEREKDISFTTAIAQAVKPLKRRGLLYQRGYSVGLTKDGKENAREIIDYIKDEYGKVDWENIVDYYYRKEE